MVWWTGNQPLLTWKALTGNVSHHHNEMNALRLAKMTTEANPRRC